MTLVYEIAKQWNTLNFPVLPVAYKSKKAMVDWREYQNRLPSHTELYNWFYNPFTNLGLIVGNGLVVLDFDVLDVFDYWLPGFQAKYPQGTYMVKTRRGMHVYFHTERLVKNYHSPLLDIKAERGYVLIPPSIHPSGYEYRTWQASPILKIQNLGDVLDAEYMPEKESAQYGGGSSPQYARYDDPWLEADAATESFSVAQIKAKISILDLLPDAKPSGPPRWFKTFCPFHNDSNPSFWIDTEQQLCGCFAGCTDKPLDVIDLYARLHGLSGGMAIEEMSDGL